MKNLQKIIGRVNKAITDFDLIQSGDKIALGVSGGKDSLTLLNALGAYQKFAKTNFELVAITVDMFDCPAKYEKVSELCSKLGIEYHIVKSSIYDIVFNIRKEKNPCSLCAKLRRGILNSSAIEFGCNKVALAHNADDVIETFFMSLIYEARLYTFKPKTFLSETKLTVIRPLIYCWESEIIKLANELPIVKNDCPADHHTKREEIKKYILELCERFSNTKEKIFNSVKILLK